MKKREFIKVTGVIAAGSLILPMVSCKSKPGENPDQPEAPTTMEFTLPALPFAFDALAPNIDAQTMEIHHGKHHAGYVRKLNAALAANPRSEKTLEEMLAALTDSDSDKGVRNNGGGHYNHSLFWSILSPKPILPSESLANAIVAEFDSYEGLVEVFSAAAATVFGSGWAWLCLDEAKRLKVTTTPNQDNPLMSKIVETPGIPILGLDVWEHAYYLNYQNRRKEYIANFFNVIDWKAISDRYDKLMG